MERPTQDRIMTSSTSFEICSLSRSVSVTPVMAFSLVNRRIAVEILEYGFSVIHIVSFRFISHDPHEKLLFVSSIYVRDAARIMWYNCLDTVT